MLGFTHKFDFCLDNYYDEYIDCETVWDNLLINWATKLWYKIIEISYESVRGELLSKNIMGRSFRVILDMASTSWHPYA